MNSSTPQSSLQPASLKGGVPLAIGALLIAQTLPLSPANAQVTEANSAEICTSPTFGRVVQRPSPPVPPNAESDKCTDAPAAAIAAGLTQTEIFWVPTAAQRQSTSGPCSSPRLLKANVPKGIKTFIMVNILPTSRQLQVTGTGNADVLIGSAGSSDKLIGNGGLDTYVVGGLQASLTVQAPDRVFPSSPASEQDDLTFGGSTEFIHIKPGDGQSNPGEIQTPLSSTPTITPRGGSAVPASRRPSATSCQASLSPWKNFNLAYNTSLARLPTLFPDERTDIPASLLAQPLQPVLDTRNPVNGSWENRCNTQNCNINPDDSRADVGNKQGVPGAPTLRGFNIESPDADQIFVPSRNLVFQGEPINVAFPPGKEIPILVVQEGVRFGPARLLKQSQISQLQRQSRGLLSVKNKDIPLVYFRANGLLVISQSNAPLGTAENPGVVVARLLDSTNRPLDLPVSNDGIYPSRFLTFTPVRIPR
jgi:hypothetical protein